MDGSLVHSLDLLAQAMVAWSREIQHTASAVCLAKFASRVASSLRSSSSSWMRTRLRAWRRGVSDAADLVRAWRAGLQVELGAGDCDCDMLSCSSVTLGVRLRLLRSTRGV